MSRPGLWRSRLSCVLLGPQLTKPSPSIRYIPGSIVRITLKNFVTYDDVSFRPGPHLNMIIGPNGTGKSTIACAIALGLGYKATLLGRAEGVASYVKQGKEHGYIEIELKGHPGENNVTIKRQLQSQKNDNVYFVNGERPTRQLKLPECWPEAGTKEFEGRLNAGWLAGCWLAG